MYSIYFPAEALRPFVECVWFLQAEIAPPGRLEEHIFADARADIVINFGSPYQRLNAGWPDNSQIVRVSNLDAQRRYPVSIFQQGQIDIIGIRFRPGGLAAFVPMPVGELDGLTIGLLEAFGPPGLELEQRLYEALGQRSIQLELLNDFFMKLQKVRREHSLVTDVVATIEEHHGNISIGSLSATYGYSVRTLDRRFQQVMGFSPKLYARMVRFRQALSFLVHNPQVAWADIVGTFGYYDQPHFIRDFVEFTGTQPATYRAEIDSRGVPTAPNYVQFLQDKIDHLC